METASGLLSSACQLACGAICQQLNYIRKLRENEETMRREWRTLRSEKNDICKNLNAGRVRHGREPRELVTKWLEDVGKIEEKVESSGSGGANHMCFKGCCPNYYSHLKRSKEAVEMLHEVKDLQEKGKRFAQGEDLFNDLPPETSSSLPATTLHGTSAGRTKEEILQCIMNPEVSKIGVWGMGGIGKTTIMTEIYNELNKKKVFEIVIWVTVSSSFTEEELQNKIAERLHCPLPLSGDLTTRAQVLHEAFRRRGNFVIILDDIWKRVSLQNVGIPEPNRSNRSKVVWTTRFVRVCNSMESEKEIIVERLTEEAAWSLFKDKVGAEDAIMSTEIQPIAKEVAKECGGLPLALITVGRALRKTYQPSVWRDSLQQLKTSRADQICGMGDEVFGSLKFSYNWLSNDTTRACLLYCALYPEDYEILVDDLIEHWMVEGLINETGSIQTDKDRGHAYLKELKDACMIESIRDDDKYVKMHDLIRDLAINITREPPLFMVKAGLQLKESPEEEEWVESLERVSLMRTQIEAFQGQPNCPQLSTLLLQSSYGSVIFCDTFFKHMHNLRVLNLSNSGIKSLPDSLSDLVNLHALILTDCYQLACLPSLAKLHKLKLLKLGGLSFLKELPHGLENLVKLRHLDISHGGWRRFPSGALSKMSRLEILFMHRSRWSLSYGNNGSNGDAKDNSTFGEIVRLKKLTKFSANFADVLTFNNYIKKADEFEFLRNFDCFNFILSYEYCGFNVINLSKEKVALPGTANYLVIGACNFIQLADIFHWDDLRQLIYCGIHRCNKIERIVESNGVMNGEIVFPSLETLHLTGLHSFRGLCKEKVHEETLKNLRRLLIHTCHKLKYLIPIDLLVNNLQNLEEISVRDCEEMEHIISGNTDSAMVSLPKLKELHLYRLRALTSICQGNKLVCDSFCKITIDCCPKLKKLPSLPVSIAMVVTEEWWETLEWEDPQLKEQLQPSFQDPDDTLSSLLLAFRLADVTVGPHTIRIAKLDPQELGY